MRNLFVCHTQANLILAAGLARGRFYADDNDLILFRDFMLSPATEEILKGVFTRVLIRDGVYPPENKKWSKKASSIPKDFSAIKTFMDKPYDKVFEICDTNLQEIYILKRAHKVNKDVEMIWLEDGSYPYFVNTTNVDGLNSNDFTRLVRQIIFKNLHNFGKFYDFEGGYMAANRNLKQAYITLKGKEREIFKNKEIVQITADEYLKGISLLFPVEEGQEPLQENALLLALDKLDTYISIDKLREVLVAISGLAAGKKVYFKLHPKEDMWLPEFDNFTELNKNKGIEYFYSLAMGKPLTVVGCKSTALMSAKILGYTAISVAVLMGENAEDLVRFYNAIGVSLPQSEQELKALL